MIANIGNLKEIDNEPGQVLRTARERGRIVDRPRGQEGSCRALHAPRLLPCGRAVLRRPCRRDRQDQPSSE